LIDEMYAAEFEVHLALGRSAEDAERHLRRCAGVAAFSVRAVDVVRSVQLYLFDQSRGTDTSLYPASTADAVVILKR
jgi:hypothetical protein